jgi:hypothetical protein
VHYSRRRQLAAEVRTRRVSGPRRSSFGLLYGGGRGSAFGGVVTGPAPATPASAAEADAEMTVRLLSERATAARAETVWATGTVDIAGPQPGEAAAPAAGTPAVTPAGTPAVTPAVAGWLEPLTSRWSKSAIAVVLVPALILLIICLL